MARRASGQVAEPPPPGPMFWPDVKLVDLVAFCRPGIVTSVSLHLPDYSQREWLRFGVPVIRRFDERGGSAPYVTIGARLGRGATDEEESSAWAVSFAVIGFEFDFWDGFGIASGWIKPDAGDTFHVPPSGWDPFAGAATCDGKHCRSQSGPHPIVGYVPKAAAAAPLFDLVKGTRITLRWHLPAGGGE